LPFNCLCFQSFEVFLACKKDTKKIDIHLATSIINYLIIMEMIMQPYEHIISIYVAII